MTLKYSSSSKDSQCKETFIGSSGIIQTPGFPFGYAANTHCEWKIKNTRKRALRLRFNFFDIESQASCKYDYLDIRTTSKKTNNVEYVGRFCGTHVSHFLRIDPGKEMRLVFNSDSSIQRRGFHAEFQMV